MQIERQIERAVFHRTSITSENTANLVLKSFSAVSECVSSPAPSPTQREHSLPQAKQKQHRTCRTQSRPCVLFFIVCLRTARSQRVRVGKEGIARWVNPLTCCDAINSPPILQHATSASFFFKLRQTPFVFLSGGNFSKRKITVTDLVWRKCHVPEETFKMTNLCKETLLFLPSAVVFFHPSSVFTQL